MQDAERIATLYTIEKDIGGRSAEERREARQEKPLPILADLDPWPREKLARISQKTKLAEAIRYALSRWEGLTRLVHDIEIDCEIASNGRPGRVDGKLLT